MGVQTQLSDPQIQPGSPQTMAQKINSYLKLVQQQVNRLSTGGINASSSASTAPPPANSVTIYSAGDYIRNTAPTVQGSAGSQYVVKGWLCVAGGTPGTWVQDRGLTGT
jgi:hypothetical protein